MRNTKRIKINEKYYATVSAEDFARVSKLKWVLSSEGWGSRQKYAVHFVGKPRKKIRMHRYIFGLGPISVDQIYVMHLDGNGLNNTRGNLLCVTKDERDASQRGPRKARRKK